MAHHLDSLLDDALAGFDDDEGGDLTLPISKQAAPAATAAATAAAAAAAAAQLSRPSLPGTEPASGSAAVAAVPEANSGSQAAAAASCSLTAAAAATTGKSNSSGLQFDPLKRKKKSKANCNTSKAAAAAAAAGKAATAPAPVPADLLGSSSSSSSNNRPALTPQVHQLQEDLAKLVSEWSQALHPEPDIDPLPGPGQQQQRASSVLQALAEQTQRTVDEQARLQPPLAAGSAAAAAAAPGMGAAEGGEQQHVNMIVDVVMQHLLSKDVLYQPMKEIMDKYPPWLSRHTAAGASSSLPAAELERYKQQYAAICALCQAYETEPDNTAKIMELLQQMQACGEPPAEIVEEMSSAIAADLPGLGGERGGLPGAAPDLDLADLGLDSLPQDLKNCPVQ